MPTETTVRPTTAPKRVRPSKVKPGKFFTSKAEVDKKFVTIRLPVSVAEYLELENGKTVYYSLTNGVIQVSANVPNLSIPILNVANGGFLPQS